jgi:hypothetical protein
MTNDESMPNDPMTNGQNPMGTAPSEAVEKVIGLGLYSVIWHSSLIRHSTFVIRH